MTYEEKLEKIVGKLHEERKLTRQGHTTKITFNDHSFTKVRIREICKILLQLQDDKGVVEILEALQPIETVSTEQIINPSDDDNYDDVGEITVEVGEKFDDWYENYLMGQKTDLQNLDYINMLRVYDVILDINQQIQLTDKTKVYIHLIPSIIRFQALFPADSIGLRDQYCENRLGGLKYLKNKGAIDNYSYGSNGWSWDSMVEISLKLSAFNDFYKSIQNEYIKRNKPDKTDEPKEVAIKVVRDKVDWPNDFVWRGKSFIFGKYGSVDFSSDDRKLMFKTLADKKGGWATISELVGKKDPDYVRSTIKQIEDRLPEEIKKHLTIISTQDDESADKPKVGAYRIKLTL